jgi:hypothetical protein
LEVRNADGTSRSGKLTLDGFRLTYQVGKGPKKTVWANGETDHSNFQIGERTAAGNSIIQTVTTDDNNLEITTRFTLNQERGALIIVRSVKNNSGQRLNLLAAKQFLDPKLLAVDGATCNTTFNEESVRQASQRVTAHTCENNECEFATRPPHDPPCTTLNCFNQTQTPWRAFMAADVIGNDDCNGFSLKSHPKPNMRLRRFGAGVIGVIDN